MAWQKFLDRKVLLWSRHQHPWLFSLF